MAVAAGSCARAGGRSSTDRQERGPTWHVLALPPTCGDKLLNCEGLTSMATQRPKSRGMGPSAWPDPVAMSATVRSLKGDWRLGKAAA